MQLISLDRRPAPDARASEAEGREVVAALYARYYGIIAAKIRRSLGEGPDADDLAQETFARLWAARVRFEALEPSRRVAWIYTTAHRLVIDRLRRRRASMRPTLELTESREIDGRDPDSERRLGQRRLLAAVVDRLDDEALQVVTLIRIDGLSQREAAKVLGCSERSVRRRLVRADGVLARLEELR